MGTAKRFAALLIIALTLALPVRAQVCFEPPCADVPPLSNPVAGAWKTQVDNDIVQAMAAVSATGSMR